MKLSEFVKVSLLDIMEGVDEARKKASYWIAPGALEGDTISEPQYIKFDLRVSTNSEGGGSIRVLGLAEVEGGLNSETVQSVSFEIPIYLQAPK